MRPHHPHGCPCCCYVQARDAGDGTFQYRYIMMDKSRTEIAAVKQLTLSGDARLYLLCYFHMLQDWERFLSSAESGVREKGARHAILVDLAALAHQRDQKVFEEKASNMQLHGIGSPKFPQNATPGPMHAAQGILCCARCYSPHRGGTHEGQLGA